jgi:hypothetical protein
MIYRVTTYSSAEDFNRLAGVMSKSGWVIHTALLPDDDGPVTVLWQTNADRQR